MKQSEQWIIFYRDKSIFDWQDGRPWAAPRTGVEVIVCTHPVTGYVNIHRKDYFYYEEASGGWQTAEREDMVLHLIRAELPLVLFGEMMSDEEYREFFRWTQKIVEERYGWKYVKPG